MLVDSHCHLQLIDYEKLGLSLEQVLIDAAKAGVCHFLCVATVLEHYSELIDLCRRFPQIKASIGLHPGEQAQPLTAEALQSLAQHPSIVALGETGLDYYHQNDPASISSQKANFRTHIQVGHQIHKPLIIHTRNASLDTLSILQEEKAQAVGGVFHCFTEDWATACGALDLNFYISFSGIITFKNAESLRAVVRKMPLERILIETDSPYLAPVPMRGTINQPLYVQYVAAAVAGIKGLSVEELAIQTTKNYRELFKIEA